jgi:H+/Cl- antiporter ClcA/predicted transcriptional regulator
VSSQFNEQELGDFTVTPRVVMLAVIALFIGIVCSFVALALLRLIGLFGNLFFFGRLNTDIVSPAGNSLGLFVLVVPVIGGLVVGLMARYGSERIRGHGIPEAMEAILIGGSKVEPKVAVLKPLSAAISIGTGGPFGAEGPIIMTGGAVGSLIAQFFHLSSAERKTLLVAGAAGGMSATFAAPIASVALAVELLLFEFRPRSFVPVAASSATAAVMRRYLIGTGPLFPVATHPVFVGAPSLIACIGVGIAAGCGAVLLVGAVYASEDGFKRLPLHWMWWPAIGGVIIGVGGLVFPRALGVGYDVVASMLAGQATVRILIGIAVVKSIIWAGSLGSGTSGGVLAPLLMIGAALGGLEAHALPSEGAGFWPMISMGAMLAAMMRTPLTAIIFTVELTHDPNSLLPLLIAVGCAYGISVLTMKRSILTEKVARRGYHLSREYAVDPLEILAAKEVMRTEVLAFPEGANLAEIQARLNADGHRTQHLYPVLKDDGQLVGVVTRGDLRAHLVSGDDGASTLREKVRQPVVARADDPLRVVAYRMAESGFTRMPVVTREARPRVVGMISLHDLLKARVRNLEAEKRREVILRLPRIVGRRRRKATKQAGV